MAERKEVIATVAVGPEKLLGSEWILQHQIALVHGKKCMDLEDDCVKEEYKW